MALKSPRTRIFVTRDRDFGRIVFMGYLKTGMICLRMLPSTINAIHKELEQKELEQILKSYSFGSLKSAFVVIEPSRHRFRKQPTQLYSFSHK